MQLHSLVKTEKQSITLKTNDAIGDWQQHAAVQTDSSGYLGYAQVLGAPCRCVSPHWMEA